MIFFYLELDILPVRKIFLYTIGIFIYKYMNGMLPELFLDMFTSIAISITRQAMNKHLLVSIKSTSRGQQSITYIGLHLWSFILSKINLICSIGSLKTHSSFIAALPSFKFNMVTIDIKKVNVSPNHEL